MMATKILKSIFPTNECILHNLQLQCFPYISKCKRYLTQDSGESTNSYESKIGGSQKEPSFIDDQYFSEIFERDKKNDTEKRKHCNGKGSDETVPDDPQTIGVEEDFVRDVSEYELNEIDKQYFASINSSGKTARPSDVKRNVGVGKSTWIYDSIQEIDSDHEILKFKKDNFQPELIKTEENKIESTKKIAEEFKPHEMPTSLYESVDFSDLSSTNSLADLRSELESVRKINKMTNKRDAVRGVRPIPKIQPAVNLPANVQLGELEPSVAEAVKAITKKKTKINRKKMDYLKLYGTPDPESPLTTIPCCGCGAFLHCKDSALGGYLASEKFKKLSESELVKTPCQRCTLLMAYNHAINISVTENDFKEIFRGIRNKQALILVMVDLLDFPISFIPGLKSLIGWKNKVMIIGNKIDLLPADSYDCHNRISKQLQKASIERRVCAEQQILGVHLISSKLGYGVEKLITSIQTKWATRGDVYLIGTANSGKSTLFNRFLNSDFCKTKAKWVYKKATVSRWPGTTLNLLKFPILKPNIDRIDRREARLREEKEQYRWFDLRDKEFNSIGYFRGHVGRSFEGNLYRDHTQTFNMVSGNKRKSPNLPFKFKPSEFSEGKWLYDTPGVIRDEQVLSKLTSEELGLCVASEAFRPKTMVIKAGQTIFLAGLGRLDYLEGIQTIFCTVFAAPTLPVRVVNTEEADEFYKQNVGYPHLKVPAGGDDRLKTLAPLTACDDVTIEGINRKESAADVLFASAGWLAITPNKGLKAVLRPYTIGGLGCVIRTPSLLPFIVNLRGSRLARSQPFYRVDVKKLVQY